MTFRSALKKDIISILHFYLCIYLYLCINKCLQFFYLSHNSVFLQYLNWRASPLLCNRAICFDGPRKRCGWCGLKNVNAVFAPRFGVCESESFWFSPILQSPIHLNKRQHLCGAQGHLLFLSKLAGELCWIISPTHTLSFCCGSVIFCSHFSPPDPTPSFCLSSPSPFPLLSGFHKPSKAWPSIPLF